MRTLGQGSIKSNLYAMKFSFTFFKKSTKQRNKKGGNYLNSKHYNLKSENKNLKEENRRLRRMIQVFVNEVLR